MYNTSILISFYHRNNEKKFIPPLASPLLRTHTFVESNTQVKRDELEQLIRDAEVNVEISVTRSGGRKNDLRLRKRNKEDIVTK